MKKIIILLLQMTFISILYAQETVVFYENFESASRPAGWTEEKVVGQGGGSGTLVSWQYTNGGYYDFPEDPAQGNRNAMFQLESDLGESTKLITPAIDLSDISKPELRFSHVQQVWENEGVEYWDRLKIYYKRGFDSTWVLLEAYENAVADWTDRSILLPDSSLSSTYYIAFEGITGFGWGTCIDTMRIVETGTAAKYLDSYTINQATTDFIPTNTQKNPILYINFDVKGNSGSLFLDSLKVTSLNTNDDDIITNGVKLYVTTDTIFDNPVLIPGAEVSFVNGVAHFKNIAYDLPRGESTIWITYDIEDATDHDIHNNVVDAKITTESMYINGYAYPFSDKSPEGSRLLKEALFNDSFETDLGWIFNGSFERGIPQGYGEALPGNPDPSYAFSGSNVIGTDLTSDGGYSPSLTNRKDSAVSPVFNCLRYKDVKLYFKRWLNTEYWDRVYIDISTDNRTTWSDYWSNSGAINDDSWKSMSYDLDNADFKENVSIRFGLGPTNNVNQYTGWNIDDFIVIGDFISKDVGITKITLPETGCGHTTSDVVSVYIENYAGEVTPVSIPLRYEIDGSGVYETEAYASTINVDDSAFYTFSAGADLSAPGPHTIKVETILEGDEITSNNSMTKSIFSFPTITIPYSQNFETNYGYYLSAGKNTTWEYGTPSGLLIDDAASGTKAWVTNLNGPYPSNDSTCLVTPCFDFTGADSIIFEFKSKGISEDKADGLTLLYSIDDGTTWDVVPNDNDYYWDWFNEESISSLGLPGIDTTNGVWTTYRKLLPPEVSNLSSVKFKFLFQSNTSNNLEGFGIDDIKIYEAPADVGVASILEPYDACEWSDSTEIKVSIENYGITTLDAGSKIPVAVDFQGSYYVTDTLTLATELAPGGTAEFTFDKTVDMSSTGDYSFDVYTLLETNSFFYNETTSNDTVSATVRVDGMPDYDIGWIVGSDDLDTLLDAGAGYDDYSWYFGGSEVSDQQTYRAQAEGIYYVTVSRTNVLTCEADDSLKLVPSEVNVKMDSVLTTLEDSCLRFEPTELKVTISNLGIVLNVDDTIPFGYQINNLPVVYDTLILTRSLTVATDPATDTINFTFDEKCDLTEPGEYKLKVFTNFLNDLYRNNDTVTHTINTWGLPDVEFAYDTIYSSQADTLTLDAGAGFDTYFWNPGDSVTQTITPTNTSYYYKVTVTDVHACGSDKDSVYIETHDLGVTKVNTLPDVCADDASASQSLNIEVTNFSENVYAGTETIDVYYNYDNTGWVHTTPTLTGGLAALGTINLIIDNIDVTSVGEHSVEIYTSSDIDANNSNDTLIHTFNTWPEPDVDLAYDTIYTTRADTVILVAQDGFATYKWDDNSTNDSLIIDNNLTHKYKVTVTDINACGSDSDSTMIITYNLGPTELVNPESDCEHSSTETVVVKLKNYGEDVIPSGTTIPVGYIFNEGSPVNENYVLTSDLDPLSTVNIPFNQKVNLSAIGSYKFELYSAFTLDANKQNDTITEVIKTFGYPSIELGEDILTTQPDTVELVAEPGFNFYIWNEGTKNDTLIVTNTSSFYYEVTVRDINGCTATDGLNVYTYNLTADSLNAPIEKCDPSENETLIVGVTNYGGDTLQVGDEIEVGYVLNSQTYVSELFTVQETFYPDSTELFTFTGKVDLSDNMLHEFKLFAKYAIVDVDIEDTTTVNVDNLNPDLELGGPVVWGGSEYEIDAGPGYTTYEWFDDETTDQTYMVDINNQTANNYYAVTVTNSYGCSTADSLYLEFTIVPDLGVVELYSPESECWQSSKTYQVSMQFANEGVVNLSSGTSFTVGYTINDQAPVTETYTLTSAMDASDTREHTFANEITFDEGGIYVFKPFVKLANDENAANDTLLTDNEVNMSFPVVNLGAADTVYFNDSYTIIIQNSEQYDTFEWSTGETTETITITETGTYTVTVTDELDCQGIGKIHCINNATGIDEIIGNGYSIKYYPNPASDVLKVEIANTKSKDVVLEMVNVQGQIIYNTKFTGIQNTVEEVRIDEFAKGIYYIRFTIDDKFYIRKLIIQ